MLEFSIAKVKEAIEKRREAKYQRRITPNFKIELPDVIKANEEQLENIIEEYKVEQQIIDTNAARLQDALLIDLDNQDNEIRIARAKLTNQYNPMIRAGASRLELKSHYQKIESLTGHLKDIFNKRRYVKKFGRLPDQGGTKQSILTNNILALKDKKRKLTDKRCKLAKKIKVGEATNAKKLNIWKLEMDQANREYEMTCDKIKQLNNG